MSLTEFPKTEKTESSEKQKNKKFRKTESLKNRREGGLLWRSTAPGITRNF